ncbi:hypothetical protein ACROYT_G044216 [Oculina patagonica]
MELVWAMKAHHQAETYLKLISAIDASRLHLTKYDDDIYRQFKRYFKMLKVDVIKPEDFKSEEANLSDTSTLTTRPPRYTAALCSTNRSEENEIDCSKGYDEENTILVTRIQFYAVEIARNRRRLNKHFLEKSASTEDSHER